MQRSCQALPLFAGAALLGGWLLAERWKNQWTKCAVAALIAVVLLNVTIEIHGFFSGNYSLRMSEYRILDRVAADLQRDYPLTEKPVLFVGSPNARYYVLEPGLLITQDRLGYSVASALLGIEDSAISVAAVACNQADSVGRASFPRDLWRQRLSAANICPTGLPSFAGYCSTVYSRQRNCRDDAGIPESWIYKGDGDLYNCTFW